MQVKKQEIEIESDSFLSEPYYIYRDSQGRPTQLILECLPGVHVKSAINEAWQYILDGGMPVSFIHNGVSVSLILTDKEQAQE